MAKPNLTTKEDSARVQSHTAKQSHGQTQKNTQPSRMQSAADKNANKK